MASVVAQAIQSCL